MRVRHSGRDQHLANRLRCRDHSVARQAIFQAMDQRMARRKRNLAAGYAPDRKAGGCTEGNVLRLGVVRVDDIESLVAQALA